jgi:hypothetical protein
MFHSHPAGCALACALLAPAASAQSLHSSFASLAPSQLRLIYLECARLSEADRLPQAVFSYCTDAAQALLEREFGGDFEAQLTWWRAAREAHRPTPSANPYLLVERLDR